VVPVRTAAARMRAVSTSRLWLVLAVALPVLAALLAALPTVDLTYQLRAGSEMLASGAIPTVDTWTFTAAGEPWVDQQWGAQVLLHLAERVGGWTGLALLRASLVGVIVGMLLIIARRRGLDERTAALLALAAFVVASPAMALRPQLLGMACFALVLLLVTVRHAHPRLLWLVPVVVAVWANLHGSFFLGPVVLGLAWLEDLHDRAAQPHRALVVALVSVGAACVTPFGPAVWTYAVGLSVDPQVTGRITEWQPTSLRTGPGILFFASVAIVAVAIARRGRVVPWPTLAWLGVFLAIGLYAERGVAWWPPAAVAAIAGGIIPAWSWARRVDPPLIRRLNAGLVAVLAVVGIALLPLWRPVDRGTQVPTGVLAQAPSGITGALREIVVPGERIFNPQIWGSWFIYALPDATVAIDSRIELFPAAVWNDYEAVVDGVEGWQQQLEEWGVTLVVTSAAGGAGMDARLQGEGWSEVYRDATGAVFASPTRTIGAVTIRTGRLDSRP
jgi:hypothetical protein